MQRRNRLGLLGVVSLLFVATLVTGCHPRYVGLRRSLKPPTDLDTSKVSTNPEARQRAIEIYKERRLMKQTIIMGIRTRSGMYYPFMARAFSQGGGVTVHWKEIMEQGGKAEMAKKLWQQRVTNTAIANSALAIAIGADVGAATAFTLGSIIQDNPGEKYVFNRTKTMVLAGTLLGVGIAAHIVHYVFLLKNRSTQPRLYHVAEAAKQYNRKLLTRLGLSDQTRMFGLGARRPRQPRQPQQPPQAQPHHSRTKLPYAIRCLGSGGKRLSRSALTKLARHIQSQVLECAHRTNHDNQSYQTLIKVIFSFTGDGTHKTSELTRLRMDGKINPAMHTCLKATFPKNKLAGKFTAIKQKLFCTYVTKPAINPPIKKAPKPPTQEISFEEEVQ